MAKRRNRILLLLGAVTLLLGCAGLPPAFQFGSMALTGMSYIVTGKGPSDHVISAFAEQDCALFRVVEAQPVCIDKQPDASTALAADANVPEAARKAPKKRAAQVKVAATSYRMRTRQVPQYFLVFGSFSSESHAQRFRETMSAVHVMVVRFPADKNSKAQYRVVTGPFAVEESLRRRSEIARTLRRDVWRLRLCMDSLREPPCTNAPMVVASR